MIRKATGLIAAILFSAACDRGVVEPAAFGGSPSFASGTGSGGAGMVADALAGDFAGTGALLVSTCAGEVSKSFGVDYGPGAINCAAVTPAGSSYALTDDIILLVRKDKGLITSVRLWGQDVVGPDGVMHDTDPIPVAVPVAPTSSGFVLHVHASDVPVFRLSGHTGGPRVAQIGRIAIGDIVYRNP